MVPEAVIAILACARIGPVHSVVFGGFAARRPSRHAYRRREAAGHPVGLVRHRGQPDRPYKPLLEAAIAEARAKPEHCVILQRAMCRADLVAGSDHDWHELIVIARPADCRLG
jgi:propionyl-CoA synthetase